MSRPGLKGSFAPTLQLRKLRHASYCGGCEGSTHPGARSPLNRDEDPFCCLNGKIPGVPSPGERSHGKGGETLTQVPVCRSISRVVFPSCMTFRPRIDSHRVCAAAVESAVGRTMDARSRGGGLLLRLWKKREVSRSHSAGGLTGETSVPRDHVSCGSL